MPKSTRRRQAEAVVLTPLDWLEERSGLVGYTKWFLFRHVPRDINWMQTLGSATLTAFLVQAITGVVLAMYYKPDPRSAYASVQNITAPSSSRAGSRSAPTRWRSSTRSTCSCSPAGSWR